MKRSPMPARTAPIERRTGLKRGGRLRARSARMMAVYRQRGPLVGELLESRPWCEIRWDDGCQRRATQVHEPRMRSRGADICDEAECITGCAYCHRRVHDNPAEATRRGFMIPSGPAGKPWKART